MFGYQMTTKFSLTFIDNSNMCNRIEAYFLFTNFKMNIGSLILLRLELSKGAWTGF